MAYLPTRKKFELEMYPGAFSYYRQQYTSFNGHGLKFTADPSIGDVNAKPYVKKIDEIGLISYGGTTPWWVIPVGTFLMTFEFSQKWDVTATSGLNTLKSQHVDTQYSGQTYTIQSINRQAYDTGRNISTGYNVMYFKGTWLVNVTAVGTVAGGNPGLVPYFFPALSSLGLYDANWEQFKRKFTLEKIDDVSI